MLVSDDRLDSLNGMGIFEEDIDVDSRVYPLHGNFKDLFQGPACTIDRIYYGLYMAMKVWLKDENK